MLTATNGETACCHPQILEIPRADWLVLGKRNRGWLKAQSFPVCGLPVAGARGSVEKFGFGIYNSSQIMVGWRSRTCSQTHKDLISYCYSSCRSKSSITQVQWEFQDPKMEVLYHIRPYFLVQWLMQNTSLWPGHEARSGTTRSLKPGSWKKPRPLCPGLAFFFKGTQVDDL